MTKRMILLSSLDPNLTQEEVMNYLLDNKVYIVINDLLGRPYVKYDLDELLFLWDQLTNELYWGR